MNSKFSKKDYLQRIAKTLDYLSKSPASGNVFINNNGLSYLARVLFYEKENNAAIYDHLTQKLEGVFGKEGLPSVLESLRRYQFTSFYTPHTFVKAHCDVIKEKTETFQKTPRRILEPAAGNGLYAIELAKRFPNSRIDAIEPDRLSFELLKHNSSAYKNIYLHHDTFEEFLLKKLQQAEQLPRNPGETCLDKVEKYDLIVSNIPFSEINIGKFNYLKEYLDLEKEHHQTTHFFMTQLPRLVNPGGECHIITSQSFLNKESNKPALETILNEHTLTGAIRFNDAFFASENTRVVADLVAFEKIDGNRSPEAYSEWERTLTAFDTINLKDEKGNEHIYSLNRLFYLHPERVNGAPESAFFHNKPAITITPDPQQSPLAFFEQAFKPSYLVNTALTMVTPGLEKKVPKIRPELPEYPLGSIFFHNQKPHFYDGQKLEELTRIKPKDYDALGKLIHLRDRFTELDDSRYNQNFSKQEITKRFDSFIEDYNLFCFQYGSLSTNIDTLFSRDYKSVMLQTIEIKESENQYGLNPVILNLNRFLGIQERARQISQEPEALVTGKRKTTEPDLYNVERACFESFNINGYIDIEAIAHRYQVNPGVFVKEAIDKNIAFFDPVFTLHTDTDGNIDIQDNRYEFQLKSIVYAGNIEAKIQAFESYELPFDIMPEKVIAELHTIKNERIGIHQIIFDMSSGFIPKDIKEAFLQEILRVDKVELMFFPSESKFHVDIRQRSEEGELNYNIQYQVDLYKGRIARGYKKVFNSLVNGKTDILTYTVEDVNRNKITYIDKEATELARHLHEQLNSEFKAFVCRNEKYATRIEKLYYQSFLATIPVQYDSSILQFPGLEHEPYKHQKSAALFTVLNQGGLIDHKVGHGKTLTMALASLKLIELKKAKRVVVATKKSIKEQLFMSFYINVHNTSGIKTLLMDDKNFNRNNAGETLHKVAHSDAQILIMHHEQLQLLPFDHELIQETCQEKIDNIDKDYELQKRLNIISKDTRALEKGLIQRKASLTDHLEKINLTYQSRLQSNYPKLEALEIGHIMIDECHVFKNVGYTTRHDRVAGLNRKLSPDKNLLLEYLIRHIQKQKGGDRGVTFLSGTPISNSAMEIYALMHYLRPNALKESHLENFDAFASAFIKKTTELEPDILGNYKAKERFRYYINVPELAKLYNSFTHISDLRTFNPHGLSVHSNFVPLEPTENIRKYIEHSKSFLSNDSEQRNLFGYRKYNESALKAKSILTLTQNKKMCVDPLLINNESIGFMPFDKGDQVKLYAAAKDIHDLYIKTTEHKGVQLVFSDIGVPGTEQPYNVFEALKNILTDDFRIPAKEIAFIHDNYTPKKRAELMKNTNAGTVRVVFGSTDTLGTGLNIQERVVGITHLDIPYKPDVFEQRDGRGVRAGNKVARHYNNEVKVNTYGIKGTSDIFMFNLVKVKQFFIEQVKNASCTERILDSGNIDDNGTIGYHYMTSALSGNIEQLEIDKLKIELDQLQNAIASYQHQVNNAAVKLENTTHKIAEDTRLLEQFTADHKLFSELNIPAKPPENDADTVRYFSQNPALKSYIHLDVAPDAKSYLKTLENAFKTLKDGTKEHLVLYTDIPKNVAIILERGSSLPGEHPTFTLLVQSRQTGLKYRSRKFTTITPQTLLKKSWEIIHILPDYIASRKNSLSKNERELASLEKIKNTPFPKDKAERIEVIQEKIYQLQTKNERKQKL